MERKDTDTNKVWITVSETVSTGDYENVKIEAGYTKTYFDDMEQDSPYNPAEMIIRKGIRDLKKIIRKEAKDSRRRRRN